MQAAPARLQAYGERRLRSAPVGVRRQDDPLPAGAQGVPLVQFVLLTTAGCALWAVGFVLAGLLAGSAWTAVGGTLGRPLLDLGR